MWLLTLAFILSLLVFAILVSGLQEGNELGTRVLLTPPDEIIAGTPADLIFTFDGADRNIESRITVEIINPEYGVLLLRGDFYISKESTILTYNFQDVGEYVIKTILKDESGSPIAVENFTVYSHPPVIQKAAQLKGWLLLMLVLVLGIIGGVASVRPH
jgi:hypothetical protein